MTIRTALTERLGIEHPLLLAPMAGVSGGALAAAVGAAGGLGLIGGGYGDPDWLAREQAAAGNRPVGIGFITWKLAEHPALLDEALARKPVALMLSFGDPRPFLPALRAAGVPLICQVQTVAGARDAVEAGADFIVAQGSEAGGHGDRRATMALVPAVVDAVAPLPVLAAGGIGDGRGLAAALMLGAAGVLMGSRFVATKESLAPPGARARAVAASGDDTLRSSVYDVARGIDWPGPWTIRTLGNPWLNRWHPRQEALAARGEAGRREMTEAMTAGDFDTAAVIVGEGADLIRDVPAAGDLVGRIVREAEEAMAAGMALTG